MESVCSCLIRMASTDGKTGDSKTNQTTVLNKEEKEDSVILKVICHLIVIDHCHRSLSQIYAYVMQCLQHELFCSIIYCE